MSVEDVVAEDEGARSISNKRFGDDQGLRQTLRTRLLSIL